MTDKEAINIFSYIFAIYCLLLIISSVVLNPIVLFICVKSKKIRSTSTFQLLAFNAVNDILVCIAWNEESFTDTFFNLQLYNKNLYYCRVISELMQYTTMELTSWMLVSVSLDRILSLSVKTWSKQHFSGARPYIYSVLLTMFVILVNINMVFTMGYTYIDVNGTDSVACYLQSPYYQFDWYDLNNQINVYFGFVVPYVLLIIINGLIIYKATRFERSQRANELAAAAAAAASMPTNIIVTRRNTITTTTTKSRRSTIVTKSLANKRKAQMTRSILIITFIYIVSTLPSLLYNVYFYNTVINFDYFEVTQNLMNGLQFSYSAFNFFVLFFSNKIFAQEVKAILFKRKSAIVYPTSLMDHSV